MIFIAFLDAFIALFALLLWAVLVVCYYTLLALIVGVLVLVGLGVLAWRKIKSLFTRSTP